MQEWDNPDTTPIVTMQEESSLSLASYPYADLDKSNGDAVATIDEPRPKKLLINLTETNQPNEDQFLLRTVLSTLLDYPGSDRVDLLIWSEGKRWRLEMPIITTGFCDELGVRLSEILGSTEAVNLEQATGVSAA
jgi:hypothetical protein